MDSGSHRSHAVAAAAAAAAAATSSASAHSDPPSSPSSSLPSTFLFGPPAGRGPHALPASGTTTSPRPPTSDSWRDLVINDRALTGKRHAHAHAHGPITGNAAATPPALHIIPKSQDLSSRSPRASYDSRLSYHDPHPLDGDAVTMSTSQTSLPSFASLSGCAPHQYERSQRPEPLPPPPPPPPPSVFRQSSSTNLPTLATSSCICAQLRPLVDSVASAVVRLNETMQSHVLQLTPKTLHLPSSHPIHVMQWAVEQLRSVERNLHSTAAAPSSQPEKLCDRCRSIGPLTDDRSSSSLKRPIAHDYPLNDSYFPKRQRTESTVDAYRQSPPSSLDGDDQSPVGYTESSRSHRRPPTPPHQPSNSDLAQPTPQSASNSHRLLPSPSSSLAASAPAALLSSTHTAASVSPTAASYQAPSSVHTASTSSVASQHIADLQHQITLKSLALQSLQAEHTSLLQKWHRERVKTQAIEKKSRVADQEIGELTAKNEESTDQLKAMEAQLDDLERKRADEADATAREKEQWGRMLDMSGRLHTKTADERQKLLEENARLEKRVLWYEQQNQLRSESASDAADDTRTYEGQSRREPEELEQSASEHGTSTTWRASAITGILHSRIDTLRKALDDARLQNAKIEEKTREVQEQREILEEVIRKALDEPSDIDADHRKLTAAAIPTMPQSLGPLTDMRSASGSYRDPVPPQSPPLEQFQFSYESASSTVSTAKDRNTSPSGSETARWRPVNQQNGDDRRYSSTSTSPDRKPPRTSYRESLAFGDADPAMKSRRHSIETSSFRSGAAASSAGAMLPPPRPALSLAFEPSVSWRPQ